MALRRTMRHALLSVALSATLLFSSSWISVTEAKKHKRIKAGRIHEAHEPVHIVVNKVGPFNNPTETYRYYSLPFCKSHATEDEELEHMVNEVDDEEAGGASSIEHADHRMRKEGAERHHQRLGESIMGDRRETSPYEITFGDAVDWRLLCSVTLGEEELTSFKDAIHQSFFFEMFVEDLPMWGYIGDIADEDYIIGEVEGSKTFLFSHLHFRIGINDGKIVSASVSTDSKRKVDITDVTKPTSVKFSYSVEFEEDDLPWRKRFSRYTDSGFVPRVFEIHWLSIINAFVLVLLLTAFLIVILMRVLKNDFARYMDIDEETMEEEESGWKLIHGDVFRFPVHNTLFASAIGTGTHLITATMIILILALTGFLSTTVRGSLLSGSVVTYCLSSCVSGYVSTRLYLQMNGKNWVRCALLTASLFPVPVAIVFMWVNSVALAKRSTSALPFGTLFTISCLYCLLCFPLTVFGAIAAKNYAKKDFDAPTRTTKVQREIPSEIPFYHSRFFQMCVAGFLPFSAIYIELHYIFASMWGHQIYTLFGILFFAFILIVIVTGFNTVALLYFQLAREDHRWWWPVFINGGMTGIFIYAYSFYFYFHRTGMSGILQGSFYFGYMAIVSFAIFLMLGSVAFHFSLAFVRYIYGRIKCD
mmetsp:Transcript_4286/g.6425  ORF Transcript_4286/g.6425 Transcript_4286/m.6425 type:complete len:646 (-) Transcript_4286:351-2288(-)